MHPEDEHSSGIERGNLLRSVSGILKLALKLGDGAGNISLKHDEDDEQPDTGRCLTTQLFFPINFKDALNGPRFRHSRVLNVNGP